MNLQELLSSPLVQRVGWTLLHSLWQMTAVAALTALALVVLRRRSPQARYLTICVAMALMVALFGATLLTVHPSPPSPTVAVTWSPVSQNEVLIDPAPLLSERAPAALVPTVAVEPAIRLGAPPTIQPPVPSAPLPGAAAAPLTHWPERIARSLDPYLPWLVGTWIVGMIALSLWRLGGWIAIMRLRVIGTRPLGADIEAVLARLAKRLGLRRAISAVQSAVVQTPIVVGWLRPVVLLPVSAVTGLTPWQLEAILAHELAHIARHDYVVNLLQTLVETLLFYHPAVWWASTRIRAERERCCDDTAVALCGDKVGYAEALAAVVEARMPMPAVAASSLGGRDLLDRIGRILGLSAQVSARSTLVSVALSLALVLAVVAIPLAASRGGPPQQSSTPASQPSTAATAATQPRPSTSSGPTRRATQPDTAPASAPPPMPATKGMPATAATCRLEATVYELRVSPEKASKLDAGELTSAAAIATGLEKALASMGAAKVLYRMDQAVKLSGDRITVMNSVPMVTSTSRTAKGQTISNVNYVPVGAILKVTGTPQVEGGISAEMNLQISAVNESPRKDGVLQPPTWQIAMVHKGTMKPGAPVVILDVDADSTDADGKAVVYVARIVLDKPTISTTPATATRATKPAEDKMGARLEQLSRRAVSQVGRDALVQDYQQVIADYPDDPRIADAMLVVAHLYSDTKIPAMHIEPDQRLAFDWYRRAAQTATPGSTSWTKAKFSIAGILGWSDSKAARQCLAEISKYAGDSTVVAAQVERALQSLAIRERNYAQAEEHASRLQDWYSSNGRIPKNDFDKMEVDGLINASASFMIAAYQDAPLPASERAALISNFMSKHYLPTRLQVDGAEAIQSLTRQGNNVRATSPAVRPATTSASGSATQAASAPSTAPAGGGVLGMVRASSAPTSAPASLPTDAVELGKQAFEVLGKGGKGMTSVLAKGSAYDSLSATLGETNRLSLQLRDAYVDGDQALLIGTPLVWMNIQAEPVVLHLRASRTAAGWSITAWQGSDYNDPKVLKAFLQQHPAAKHVYEALTLTMPPGGRMLEIKIADTDTGEPLKDAVIRAVVIGKDATPIIRPGQSERTAWDTGGKGREYSLITDAAGTTGLPLAGGQTDRFQLFVRHRGHVALRYVSSGNIPESITVEMKLGRTIGGVVQDEDGKPIANVTLSPWPESPESASEAKILRGNMVNTDKDGRWSLDGVPTDTTGVLVRLDHEDYVAERNWHDAGAMDELWAQTNVMVMKQTNITISGVVYGLDGKPLAGAKVAQGKSQWGSHSPRTRTDANGKYVFKQSLPGEMMLIVTADGCAPDLITIDAQKNAPPVDFHLAKSKPLRGRLVDQSGNLLVGVTISVASWRDRESLDWMAQSDAAGRFEYKDAPADSVILQVGEGRNAEVVVVEPSDDEQLLTRVAGGYAVSRAPAQSPSAHKIAPLAEQPPATVPAKQPATTQPASAPSPTPAGSAAPAGGGVLGMVRATSAPASTPASLPADAVDLGKQAFEIIGKEGKAVTSLLAKGLNYESLSVTLNASNRNSLQLHDAYVDGDQALLVGTPLVFIMLQAEPVVLHLHASRTAAGWSVTAWQCSDYNDPKILKAFLQQHPGAKHAYEAPALTAPPGGRMFAIKVVDADTSEPLKDVLIRAVVVGKDVLPIAEHPAGGIAWKVGNQSNEYTLITDAAGTVGLPLAGDAGQKLQLFVRHRGHVALQYVRDNEIPESITFEMKPGRTIGGVVQDENGKPIANANVSLFPFSSDYVGDVRVMRINKVVTDKDGHWSLDGVLGDANDVGVRLDHEDYVYERRWHDLTAMDELWAQTSVMVMKQTNITVSGIVYGPDGKPLAGAKLTQGKSKYGISFPVARTNADGKYVFKQNPPDEQMLFVTAEGCAPDMVTIDAQENAPPVDFHLAKSKPLRGRLVDQSGNPVIGTTISVETWRDRESLDWKTRTDAAGRFEYKDAPADAVKLRIGEGRNSAVVEVEPSENEQVLTLTGGDTGF